MVSVVLFKLELRAGAVGWLLLVSLVMGGVLFMSGHIVGGVDWHELVALLVDDGLFKVELMTVAVGWQLWVSLMVVVVLFKLELMVGAVGGCCGCRWWWAMCCSVRCSSWASFGVSPRDDGGEVHLDGGLGP